MIEKEIAVYLLAYNLVRWTMATAATLADVLPRALSFTGAKRVLNAFADQLRQAASPLQPATVTTVLTSIAKPTLPHRPGRIEPRALARKSDDQNTKYTWTILIEHGCDPGGQVMRRLPWQSGLPEFPVLSLSFPKQSWEDRDTGQR